MPRTSPEYALRSQRRWLLENFSADKVLVSATVPVTSKAYDPNLGGQITRDTYGGDGGESLSSLWRKWGFADIKVHKACRCWHCGKLLGERALFVSLVNPAGTTRRNNIRPACADHASD